MKLSMNEFLKMLKESITHTKKFLEEAVAQGNTKDVNFFRGKLQAYENVLKILEE